jgi:hypothetical protein
MKVSFFEEFPNKENLSKLRLVKWNSAIYIAAPSLKAFLKLIKPLKKKYKSRFEYVWWHVLKKEEGYWISVFSDESALFRIYEEIRKAEEKEIKVMLDLELPFGWPSRLFSFFSNKKIFNELLKAENTITCEYPIPNFLDFLQNKNLKSKERIKMCYSDMALKILGKSFAKKGMSIGLGCIATGIYGDEKTISPEKLGKEISMAKAYNANEVIIFRLGGLNEEYVSEIKKAL